MRSQQAVAPAAGSARGISHLTTEPIVRHLVRILYNILPFFTRQDLPYMADISAFGRHECLFFLVIIKNDAGVNGRKQSPLPFLTWRFLILSEEVEGGYV